MRETKVLSVAVKSALPMDDDSPTVLVEEIEMAMAYLAQRFAEEVADESINPEQVAGALRQPVSMATVLHDLAVELDVICPDVTVHTSGDFGQFRGWRTDRIRIQMGKLRTVPTIRPPKCEQLRPDIVLAALDLP